MNAPAALLTDAAPHGGGVAAFAAAMREANPTPRATFRRNGSDDQAIAAVVADIVNALEAEGLHPYPLTDGEPVAIYVRISNDQANDRHGVVRQAVRYYRAALAEGWVPIADVLASGVPAPVFVDNDLSASIHARKVRPSWLRLTDRLVAGDAAHVVAMALDRLYREPKQLDAHRDVRLFGRVVPVDDVATEGDRKRARRFTIHADDGAGGFDSYDLANGAQYDAAAGLVKAASKSSADTSFRIKRNNDAVRGEGRPTAGTPPMGLRRDGASYVVDDAPAALLRDAAARLIGGMASLTSLAGEWEAAGVPHRRGGARWTAHQVKMALSRPSLAGLLVHRGEVVKRDAWPAVFDAPTWDALQATLTAIGDRQRHPRRSRLFSGVFRCGVCGARLQSRGADTWGCLVRGDGRRHVAIKMAQAEGIVLGELFARIDGLIANPPVDETTTDDGELLALAARVTKLENKLAAIDAALDDDDDADADEVAAFRKRRRVTVDRLAAARDDAAKVRARSLRVARLPIDDVPAAEYWNDEATTDADRRNVLRDHVDAVTVAPGVPGRNRWTEEQVRERLSFDWVTA